MIKKHKTTMGSTVGDEVNFFLTSSTPRSFTHRIYLHNFLEHPEEMVTAIELLVSCSEEDVVEVYVNNDGGSVDSLDSLLFAMHKCKATLHGVGSGTIASAATFVLLACDTIEISPYTNFLFHSCSFGSWGKSQDVKEHAAFIYKQTSKFTREQYKHLFTEEELDDMIINKREIWIDAQEFIDRFSERTKVLNSLQEESEAMLDELPPLEILNKVTKANLVRFLMGEVDIDNTTGKVYEIGDDE